jgi:DNA replication and repair protein RecF
MRIKTLYLQNFRLYDEAFFQFSPGFNVITGPNAKGKTTILEAIYLLISGGSFRTSQLADLIRHEAPFFLVEAHFEKEGMEQRLRFAFNGKEKRISYNNSPCKNAASLFGLLKGTAMTPDDVELVKGGPAVRREFLDIQLSQIDPLYVYYLNRYQRAMRQRNALLKLKQQASISSWEHEMAQAAAYLVPRRESAARNLEITASQTLNQISGESLGLAYKTDVPGGAALSYKMLWEKGRERDFYTGHTTVGPHKDDLLVTVKEKEARYFASEGQQRSCIASLRFAGWDQLRSHSGHRPLMLIDDVGISLDAQRRERLFSSLERLGQVFVTSAEPITIEGGTHLTL